MNKDAQTDHTLMAEIARRWSPRAFADKEITDADLATIMEAARWAPSAYNEQPWRFIIAKKSHTRQYQEMLGFLLEANQIWAQSAPVLGISLVSTRYQLNNEINNSARHDLGLAHGLMAIQALHLGIYTHFMGGIYRERIAEHYQLPSEFDVVAGFALGYLGDPEQLPVDLKKTEIEQRKRKPLSEILLNKGWPHV